MALGTLLRYHLGNSIDGLGGEHLGFRQKTWIPAVLCGSPTSMVSLRPDTFTGADLDFPFC